jgi:hypothetical protein
MAAKPISILRNIGHSPLKIQTAAFLGSVDQNGQSRAQAAFSR